MGCMADNLALVALNEAASIILKGLSCITVPLTLVIVSYYVLEFRVWQAVAPVIAGLGYVTTRLITGVYDSALTATFSCMWIDDCEGPLLGAEREHMRTKAEFDSAC